MPKNMKTQRGEWLRRKKLSYRKFAEATGLDFGTGYLYFRTGRQPRRLYLDAVLAVYPDFPREP